MKWYPCYDLIECILRIGAAVEVQGVIVASIGKGQKFELKATDVKLIGDCPSDYPLQKKRHSIEFLRSIAHLRPRTNTISGIIHHNLSVHVCRFTNILLKIKLFLEFDQRLRLLHINFSRKRYRDSNFYILLLLFFLSYKYHINFLLRHSLIT